MFISIILAVALGAAVIVQKRINTTLANRLNVTAIKGEKGEKGDKGEMGLPGRDGVNGTNGRDGINGTDGVDGKPGINGINGIDGSPGADAICTCNHTPEDREGIRAMVEYLQQIIPHIGDDPRIQELLKR
jgi:hypothetical protein